MAFSLSLHHMTQTTNHNIHIIHEDEAMLVINKPAWQLSVPGKNPNMVSAFDIASEYLGKPAFVVHRLDCATSGLMIFAKTLDVQRKLHKSFRDRWVSKVYQAVLCTPPQQKSGTIELPLNTDWPNRPKQMVDYQDGKEAKTFWSHASCGLKAGVESDLKAAMPNIIPFPVYLRPYTGRTHQLRVHTQSLGHPIIGDRLYAQSHYTSEPDNSKPFKRLYLHAESLYLQHPMTKKSVYFLAQDEFSFFKTKPHEHLMDSI
ncbi:MAG TPA: RNA pseudouridine synthase [Gammaproteobacteria bacterium]|nr:RNA pseudouridine synthase [Gammaproteobacteria bacterium]HBF06766.1 RNA pseudouridine synthase [Gammaproteobacteria bacterium]HCK93168.1 RNA pseudouridine synthase [Gammaproteobacteria bacterium]